MTEIEFVRIRVIANDNNPRCPEKLGIEFIPSRKQGLIGDASGVFLRRCNDAVVQVFDSLSEEEKNALRKELREYLTTAA